MSKHETHPTYDPEPVTMPFTVYGVGLCPIGENSEWIISLGHIPIQRLVAAANHYARGRGYLNLADSLCPSYHDTAKKVSHGWAVRYPACPDNDPACPHGGCLTRFELESYPWVIKWFGVTDTTPGAFPITIYRWATA